MDERSAVGKDQNHNTAANTSAVSLTVKSRQIRKRLPTLAAVESRNYALEAEQRGPRMRLTVSGLAQVKTGTDPTRERSSSRHSVRPNGSTAWLVALTPSVASRILTSKIHFTEELTMNTNWALPSPRHCGLWPHKCRQKTCAMNRQHDHVAGADRVAAVTAPDVERLYQFDLAGFLPLDEFYIGPRWDL